MKRVKVGVVGVGRGKSMIHYCDISNDVELVAICDKWKEGLENQRQEHAELNITYYEDFDEFIKHDMDAVILANYATEHAPFAVRCLDAGKHVLSENVPCETMAQAVELCEAVERTGLVYSYAENCCYMKEPFEMWKKMKNGEIGKMIYAEGEYIHDCADIWPELTRGEPDHWRNLMYATFYATHSAGPLINMAQSRPKSVVAFETNGYPKNYQHALPHGGNAGLEIITLEGSRSQWHTDISDVTPSRSDRIRSLVSLSSSEERISLFIRSLRSPNTTHSLLWRPFCNSAKSSRCPHTSCGLSSISIARVFPFTYSETIPHLPSMVVTSRSLGTLIPSSSILAWFNASLKISDLE